MVNMKDALKKISCLVLVLLLLAVVTQAWHSHADGADHPDCSVCAASSLRADTGAFLPANLPAGELIRTIYLIPCVAVAIPACLSPANNRAPPAGYFLAGPGTL